MVTMQTRSGAIQRWLRCALFLGVVLGGATSPGVACLAQGTEPIETIRVDSDLVDLKVSVVRKNLQASGAELLQSDFLVLEDGKQQEIAFFAGENTPFDLVLLLDLSGSIAEKLKLVRRSAKRFIDATRPTDRVAIVTFSDKPRLVSALTLDRRQLKQSIDGIERPAGGTNFWDSLAYAVDTVLASCNSSRRCAVVAMTDGVDNALPDVTGEGSLISFEELMEKVQHSDTMVFPVYLDTEKDEVRRHRSPASAYVIARNELGQLAEISGTRVYPARELKDLDQVYDQVIKDLGTVYSLGYKSDNPARNGKWRAVVVQVKNRVDVSAYTKRGYYTRPEQ